jgi:hypothetical protein
MPASPFNKPKKEPAKSKSKTPRAQCNHDGPHGHTVTVVVEEKKEKKEPPKIVEVKKTSGSGSV